MQILTPLSRGVSAAVTYLAKKTGMLVMSRPIADDGTAVTRYERVLVEWLGDKRPPREFFIDRKDQTDQSSELLRSFRGE